MSLLMECRERVKILYSRFSSILKPLVKFGAAFCVFLSLNSQIGYLASIKSVWVVVTLSLISAFLPNGATAMLAALVSVGHVYAISPVLAASLFVFYLILYCLYFRLAPGQSYVALAFPVLYAFHVPYVAPILLGLFAAPISMVSIAIGVILTNVLYLIQEAAALIAGTNGEAATINVYNYMIDKLLGERYMMASIFIFILVYLVTLGVRKRSFAHASAIAIGSAAVVNMVGFLLADLMMDGEKVTGNVEIIGGTLVAAAIATIAQFFRMTLDYAGVKNVQFEDDEYYYYVKAVPKTVVSTVDKKVTRIHAQKVNSNTLNLQDEIQKAYSMSEDYKESYEGESEGKQ